MSCDKEALLKELEPLVLSINALKAGNFLQPTSTLFDAVLNNCIRLLTQHSFSVKQVPQYISKLNNSADLVNHYYNMLYTRKGTSVIPYREKMSDLATAKKLLSNIQESLGYDYKGALHFAGLMIERVFDLEKQLDLDAGTFAMFRTVFGQDRMCWITEQVINNINKESQTQEHLQNLADRDTEIYLKKKNIVFGWDDLDNLIKKLEK